MKKKLLMICTLPPPVHGSAMVSQYIKDSKLINDEFDMDFVNLSTSRKMDEIGKTSLWYLLKKLLRFLDAYVICFWKLLTHKYDLCYLAITCYGIGFLKDAPFLLLCKLFKKKIVVHHHNKGMSKYVDRPLYRSLFPLVYNKIKVILLSWHLYSDIEKVVQREQILICPNGIPEIPESEKVIQRNNKIPKLLFLSNLIESKGVYILLDACKLLKEKGHSFNCVFVGGVSKEINRFVFEQEVSIRDLKDLVKYEGPKYGEEKNYYWRNADIFVFPSYNETFGLVNLEAMQWRLPIVATNEGGIPDVVRNKENGFLCERKDAISLALALEVLITQPELCKRMGDKGYQIYKQYFTLCSFERNLVNILKTEVQ